MKKIDNIKELLRKVSLLSSLTDEQLQPIVDRIKIRKLKKSETLIYQEDMNHHIYMVLIGKVKVSVISEEGKEVTLAIRQVGDFFGELSIIDNQPTSANVVTIYETVVAILNENDFWYLVDHHKEFNRCLLQSISSNVRETNETIKRLTYNKATQRVRLLFIKLANAYGTKSSSGTTLTLNLTHQEIANLTGLRRESITLVLDEWKSSGLIDILKNKSYRLNSSFFDLN